jgi:two-component sensor histidine kinase
MKHRVKNAFAIASAISRQTSRNADSVAEYRAVLEGRLNALALAQELASREATDATDFPNWSGKYAHRSTSAALASLVRPFSLRTIWCR